MLQPPARLRLVVGILGSVAIVVGSWGVGWLGPASAVRLWPLVDLIRNTRGAVAACALLVTLGALLLLWAWITLGLAIRRGTADAPHHDSGARAGRRALAPRTLTRTATRAVVTSTLAWGIPLLVALPVISRDIFAYLGQGRVMDAGLNPYESGMSAVVGWYEIGVDGRWANTATPYGPVFVWIEQLVVIASRGLPPEIALFAFRLIAVAGLAMIAYYAWRIARQRGLNEAAVLWAVAASPLVLITFVVDAHNDALMLGLILAGVYWALKDRPLLATVLVALAVGVKPIAVIALPIIGLIWAGSNAGWGAIIRRWAAVAGIAFGSIVLLGVGMGVGVGWIAALSTPIEIGSWYSPPHLVAIGVSGLAPAFGLDALDTKTAVKLFFLAIGALGAVYLVTARRRADPLWLLCGCFAALVLFSPLIHPWYGLWLFTLLAVAGGVARPWQLRVVLYATAFLLVVGLSAPLDMIDRFRGDPLVDLPRQVLAVAGTAVLLIATEWQMRRRRGQEARDVVSAPSTPSR